MKGNSHFLLIMYNEMVTIHTERLGKKFVFSYSIMDYLRERIGFGKRRFRQEFWALKDINLEIKKGEVIGIIGDNGSGKSTLLRIIAGISQPTEGKVLVYGRLGTLLEMGAGFHPEFTGRENIYMNSSILGLEKTEIDERVSDIINFSELDSFIDRPVKTYSSGMYARLGFAIATSIDPDILLIDEVLAVGDEYFQRKCIKRIKDFINEGKTIVLVSHNLHFIQNLCARALWLKDGVIVSQGNPEAVAGEYVNYIRQRGEDVKKEKDAHGNTAVPGTGRVGGTGEIRITNVRIIDSNGKERRSFDTGEEMNVEVSYLCSQPVDSPIFGVAIFRNDGIYCYGPNTMFDGIKTDIVSGKGKFLIRYKSLPLLTGNYEISVGIFDKEHVYPYDFHTRLYNFEVKTKLKDHGMVRIPHDWEIGK